MKKHHLFLSLLALLLLATSCRQGYQLTAIERSRILVDKVYDAQPDAEAAQFLGPYKHTVDSMMSPVVGRVAEYMAPARPGSNMTNLLADILVWAARSYGEKPDFAVYNIGGMRAGFAEGEVTFGQVLDVAPFENKICFLTLSGAKVMELFRQIASVGGEAVSHGVELVTTADGQLLSALLNGKEIDAGGSYRVVTLDYLSEGNDKMEAFKAGTNVVSPQEERNNIRYIIMDYFRAEAAQGRAVNGPDERRIVVKE